MVSQYIADPAEFSRDVANTVYSWMMIQDRLQQFDPLLRNGNSYRLSHDEEGTAQMTAYTDYRGSWEMRHEVSDVLLEASQNGAPIVLVFQPREASKLLNWKK